MVLAIAAHCSNQRFWDLGIIIIISSSSSSISISIIVVVVVVVVVSCHRSFLPGTSPEPTVIPIIQASSFRLLYFPYDM